MNIKSMKHRESQIIKWLHIFSETGDKDYLGKIYETFKKPIISHCWRMVRHAEDARDLASDTFIAAFKNIATFDRRRPFFPWLRQIATNLCIDYIRRRKFVELKDPNNIVDSNINDPFDFEEACELKPRIHQAISLLKRPQRRCFSLFYIQGKSYKEIVQITGYTYPKVRSAIQNGRRNFKRLYGKHDIEF
ncbi:sigma-70 family RNA polymerase sigma factor [bacterium]|nr:sigma-70 family RNA polymerase sigma factor [bacterium]